MLPDVFSSNATIVSQRCAEVLVLRGLDCLCVVGEMSSRLGSEHLKSMKDSAAPETVLIAHNFRASGSGRSVLGPLLAELRRGGNLNAMAEVWSSTSLGS